jgi:hypothetical protein
MAKIKLDVEGKVNFSSDKLARHLHLIGTTGSGKTNALHVIFNDLLFPSYERQKACVFIVDPLGGLSKDFLSWVVSPRCPSYVRDRVLYIEPARIESVIPFNPLKFDDPAEIDFRVDRAQDVILRAWDNQNIGEMPTLARWLGLTLYSLAKLKLPLSFARFMVYPDGPEFPAIRNRQDDQTRSMWSEFDGLSANALANTLTSTRNRLYPFSKGVLHNTFATPENGFDVKRFIHERKIVVINLASQNRLMTPVSKAYGAFVVNQIISTVRGMVDPKSVSPTYLVLDEFQNFVTQDLVQALPEVRQLGLRLVLAHQSFAQLQKNDIDMTSLVFLAQNRIAFANSYMDADMLSDEFAKLTFDPHAIKHLGYSQKQLNIGWRLVETESWSEMKSQSRSTSNSESQSGSSSIGNANGWTHHPPDLLGESKVSYTHSANYGDQFSNGSSSSRSSGVVSGQSKGRSQAYQPVYKTIREESSRVYMSFDEQRHIYGRKIRRLKTGEAFVKLHDDDELYKVKVRLNKIHESESVDKRVEEFKQENFESDYFISSQNAERQFEELRRDLLTEKITLQGSAERLDDEELDADDGGFN